MPTTPAALRTSPYERAVKFGANRAKVRARVHAAVSLLIPEMRQRFAGASYDPATTRLTTPCGRHALEWRLRQYPEQPESYRNQQTACGTVVLMIPHTPEAQ